MPRSTRWLAPVVTCLLIQIMPAAASLAGTAEWSQTGFDATHTSYNPSESILSPTTVSGLSLRWEGELGGVGPTSPVVVDGMVLVTSYVGGSLIAFDAATGATVWEFRLGTNANMLTPAVAGGRVFVSSGASDFLYSVDEATGAPLWRRKMEGTSNAPPAAVTVGDVTTVYAVGGGAVYAFNGADGAVLWTQSPFEPFGLQATPSIADGVAYVIDDQPVLHAYDAVTGVEIWSTHVPVTHISVPSYAVIEGGLVFVCIAGRRLYAFDPTTGGIVWDHMVYAESPPSAANGIVYIRYRKTSQSHLLAMDEATGALLWQAVLGDSDSYSFGDGVSIANGVVYTTSIVGAVVAFDAVTGAKLWGYSTPPAARTMPVVVDGWLYVGVSNKVLAFSL